MAYYQCKKDVQKVEAGNGHYSYPMLGEAHGCTNGCCTGISYYTSTEYTPAAIHDDQEGFMVLSGTGWAKIGEEEFYVEQDMSFIAPAQTVHQMRCNDSKEPLVLFWFHAQP